MNNIEDNTIITDCQCLLIVISLLSFFRVKVFIY